MEKKVLHANTASIDAYTMQVNNNSTIGSAWNNLFHRDKYFTERTAATFMAIYNYQNRRTMDGPVHQMLSYIMLTAF